MNAVVSPRAGQPVEAEGAAAPLPDDGPDIARLRFHRHHAFIIGINAYLHVSPLKTAVADAARLGELLGAQHHFQVHPPLLDADGAQIRGLLRTMAEVVQANDRVLFYFAGHGIAADGDDGPAGYLVPADAQPGRVDSFIPMADLQAALDALPCRHLMLVLDCCFSGAFKWSSQHRATSGLMPKRIYQERFDRFVEEPARQVLTSAAYDQKALDVLQGKATGARGEAQAEDGRQHSPFALALFDALAGKADVRGGNDREGDGVLTATEIYAYVRDRIEPATLQAGQRLRQTPSFFPLRGHDKGEFMFLHPRHRLNLEPQPKRSPFKGLASFDEADAHLFYGRDRVIAELAERLADPAHRLLVVVGPSGTGKSSVIKAGLLPHLRKKGHHILPPMRPGAQPLAALEQALQAAAGGVGADGQARSVLLIDQYEELITRCADPAQRAAFDARLHALLQASGPLARVIVAVRSDFEPQLSGGLLEPAWVKGRTEVPQCSLEELRHMIVGPTLQEVMSFESDRLVDQIIGEVVQSPGALPLLSYALNELYDASVLNQRQRELKQVDYDLGGVKGALRKMADALLASLGEGERETMRRIMLRMVSVEGELAGRRVAVADLAFPLSSPAEVAAVVDRLVEARLLVRDKDTIEPAHDDLVRKWEPLSKWIIAIGRDQLILVDKLGADQRAWQASGKPGHLWHADPNLPVVRQALAQPGHVFTRAEVEFIRASVRRKTFRQRLAIGTTAVVMAALTGLMAWGWIEQRRAVGTIAAARGFSDELMFSVVDKLRGAENTPQVRVDLVTQIGKLSETLSKAGAGQDPSTQFWLNVLRGDFEQDKEEYTRAREEYDAARALAVPLARQDPNWARNLSVAYGKLGELATVPREGGIDFEQASEWYSKALAIDQELERTNPGVRVVQDDLFVSLMRLGLLERRRYDDSKDLGHARTARQHLSAALAVAERMAKADPKDALARRHQVSSRLQLGQLAFALANEKMQDEESARAIDHISAAISVAESDAAQVLDHPNLQFDLIVGYGTLADLHRANARTAAALDAARKATELAGRSANDDPQHQEWLPTYKTSHGKLVDIALQKRDLDAAVSALESAASQAQYATEPLPNDEAWRAWKDDLEGRIGMIPDLRRLLSRQPGGREAGAHPVDGRAAGAAADAPRN